MESIKNVMEVVRRSENSPNLWRESSELTPLKGEISVYTGRLADTRDLIESVSSIKKTFPALSVGFYDMFSERVMANGFTADRLRDAVAHVIDHCTYPTPTIADFISFDRTIKFRTHAEMCDTGWDEQWEPVRFPNRPKVVWVHANDIEMYNLTKYKVNSK